MMKRDLRFSRRNLLQAVGAGAALLPLLHSDPADAACLVSGIKRLYILVWPDGMLSNVSQWATPGNTPATWTLAGFQQALQPYQSDLLLLQGLDYKFIRDQPNPGGGETNGHACYPGMLTGAYYQTLTNPTAADAAGGISVDQYIGQQLQMGGYKGLVSLNLGAFVKSTGRLSWKGPGLPVIPDTDPYHVFSTYFAGSLPPPPPMPGKTDAGAPPVVDNRRPMQKSILDYVLGDLNRFSNIVGTDDKQRIAAHLQSVRNLELSLQTGAMTYSGDGGVTSGNSASCSAPVFAPCAAPGVCIGTKLDINNTNNVPTLVQMQMDLAVAAFASDLTRVVVMQIADQGAANLILTNLGFKSGGPNGNTGDLNGYHSIAHRNDADKVTCDTWFQKQVGYIIGRLKGITDPTGKSMLDSSVVVAMNNMRTGTHETTGVPVVMAGSCGGYFKTGRSLAMTNIANNQLLVSLCNAMGFPVQTFGQAQYGGELTVLKG